MPVILKPKIAAGTIRDDLEFFSTTPTHEEQMHVLYHDQGARVESRD